MKDCCKTDDSCSLSSFHCLIFSICKCVETSARKKNANLKNTSTQASVYMTEFAFFSPTVCLATESGLVYFDSRNFNTTLRWRSAEPRENLTYKYSVKYKT